MELRLLTTENEREIFAERVEVARARHGAGFRVASSMRQANKLRLRVANLYALFESEAEPAGRMMAGLAMHDLATLPQSCAEPDLSHLPPRSVFECSDLWSLSRGAGMLAWCGAAVPVRALEIRALLVYLAAGHADTAAFYTATGWVRAGEPVEHPYFEMLDGKEILSQAMILEGKALQRLITVASRLTVKSSDAYSKIQLRNPFGLSPSLDRPAFPSSLGRQPVKITPVSSTQPRSSSQARCLQPGKRAWLA